MLRKFALVFTCLVLGLGCGTGTSDRSGRINVGDKAPEFRLPDISGTGEVSSLKTVHGGNATVIVIWRMACPTCREALVACQSVYEQYSSRAVGFIGVNADRENIRGVRAFLDAEGIQFLTLWDRGSSVSRKYKSLDYTFSFFVLDKHGIVRLVQYDHPPDIAEILSKQLDKILAEEIGE